MGYSRKFTEPKIIKIETKSLENSEKNAKKILVENEKASRLVLLVGDIGKINKKKTDIYVNCYCTPYS